MAATVTAGAARVSDPEHTIAPADKANILIVDDRADKRLVFQTILEDLGQNIVMAHSGEEALRWLLDNECAVILLDVNMPGMDGLETAELIRGRRKSAHTPIIFITAYADEMHTTRGYTLGAVDYILAPVLPNVLRSKVNAFVRLFNLTSQLRRQADERIALEKEQTARVVAEESTRRANFLAEASKVMSSSLDVDAILKGATQLAVPFLADFSSVTLINEDGSVRQTETAWSGDREPLSKAQREVLDALLGQASARVAASGMREIISDRRSATDEDWPVTGRGAPPEDARLPFEQLGVFPLVARGRTRGVLALVLGRSVPALRGRRACAGGGRGRARGHCAGQLPAIPGDPAGRPAQERIPCDPVPRAAQSAGAVARGIARAAPRRATETESERLRNMMDRQVDHISHLVDDLLDVARITSGKIELRKERVELASEVRDALEACRSTEDAAGHDFSLSLPNQPLVVEADRIRLQQILENLLMNAVKYTGPDGRIGVTLARDGRDAVIRVWDTGIGIAPEMLPRIWDLFTQADTSPERVRQGLGIGLSLAQNMVRLHGGSIEARSDGLGRGSVFTVRLPCVSEAELPAPVPNGPGNGVSPPAISRRVLVVDDNADAAESLGMVLNLMGHQAQLACNGTEALRIAADFQPEIIFLDIGLPGMNGYEIAGHIRRELGMTSARLIALSGFGTEQDRRRSLESGFDAHIVKPLDPGTLPELLNDPAPTGARSTQDRAA